MGSPGLAPLSMSLGVQLIAGKSIHEWTTWLNKRFRRQSFAPCTEPTTCIGSMSVRLQGNVKRGPPLNGSMVLVDPGALQAAPLRPGEVLVNAWAVTALGGPGSVVLLTDQRFIVVDIQKAGFRKLKYVIAVSRDLETIAEPTVTGTTWDDQELHVAGLGLGWFSTSILAVRDEIAQARSLRMQKLGVSSTPPGTPITREREILTREIVKIPCRYCGFLVDQTAQRCPSCGASPGKS